MSDFASFMVQLDGKTLRVAKWDWQSHSQTCKALRITRSKAWQWSQAAWVGRGLYVWHTDQERGDALKAAILAQYPTRADLLGAHAGPAGNEAILTTDEEGQIVKIEGRLFDECELSDLTSVTSLDGMTFAEGCRLRGLIGVKSLDGVKLAEECWLSGLIGVTSLNGVMLAEGCELHDLERVESLDGVTVAERCALSGLGSVKSLDGVKLAKRCALYGLTGKAYEQYQAMMRGGR